MQSANTIATMRLTPAAGRRALPSAARLAFPQNLLRCRRSSSAFTLVELLVVIAIISMLMVLLLPALRAAQAQTRALQCRSNLRQLAGAAMMYSHDNRGRLPDRTAWSYDRTDTAHLSLAPYLNLPLRLVNTTRIQFDSVYTCPAGSRFPGPNRGWSYHRTYQLSEHMAGSCNWRPLTNEDYRGWNEDALNVRAPLYYQRVPDPSAAGLIFDGIRWRSGYGGPGSIYYNTYSPYSYFHSHHRTRRTHAHLYIFPHGHRAAAGPVNEIEMHMDDVINFSFLDGHARGLTRTETEGHAAQWTTKAFWGQ